MFHVSNMLTKSHSAMVRKGNGIFQVSPKSETRPDLGPPEFPGTCAPTNAKRNGLQRFWNHRNHTIIGPVYNVTVMQDQHVAPLAPLGSRFVVGGKHGLTAAVSTGENHRPGKLRKKQLMDRRVREHYAKLCEAWSEEGHGGRWGMHIQDYNRTLGGQQSQLLGGIDGANGFGPLQIGDHQRKWFAVPLFNFAQFSNSRGVERIRD
jgi:hypothetical protein